MKKYWQAIGITAVAVGLLYYPALKLYQFVVRKRAEGSDKEPEAAVHHVVKAFSPAYRGKHKPHHRSEHNGNA